MIRVSIINGVCTGLLATMVYQSSDNIGLAVVSAVICAALIVNSMTWEE